MITTTIPKPKKKKLLSAVNKQAIDIQKRNMTHLEEAAAYHAAAAARYHLEAKKYDVNFEG